MNKISVIIPMYNSQDYIGQCLRSVISQTYRNLEVLVIDDGSTDKSVEICQSYCQKDKRIRLLLQEHGGVSVARNRGLDTAKGAYLFFLDSDDMIHPYLLEELISHARQNQTKFLFCKYKRGDGTQTEEIFPEASMAAEKRGRRKWEEARVGEDVVWFYKRYARELLGIGGKLISREIIGTLRFEESLKRGEDTLFLHKLLGKKLWVGCCLYPWYYYRTRPDSLSHSGQTDDEAYLEIYSKVRDTEFESKRFGFAFVWENTIFYLLKKSYTEAVRKKEKQRCLLIKEKAGKERRHPMYRKLSLITRSVIWLCFYCHPVYLWFIEPFYKRLEEKNNCAGRQG